MAGTTAESYASPNCLPKIQYPNGYSVQVSGARVVSEAGVRVLTLERRRGADAVSVVVTPKG